MAKSKTKGKVASKSATKPKAVAKTTAKAKSVAKTTTETPKSEKPSKKLSQLEEVGATVYSFATQGNLKKGWEIEEFSKNLGVEAKVITHETAHHQATVELSLGKDKITVPSEGFLTITQ